MNQLYPTSLPQQFQEKEEIVFSVSEYIEYLNIALKPLRATIQGEVSQVSDYGKSAIYFSLLDKKEKAVIECLVWKNNLRSMGLELKDGMEVKIIGHSEIYAPNGRMKLMASYITPLGEGALKLAYDRLKKELEEAGFFRQDRKRKLPQYINTIGLITSEKGDAIHDVKDHLGQFGYKIYFCNVHVEGIKAVDEIVDAIRWFNENTDNIEVLIITRGGGSLESLQAFNTLELAKAIYSSKIPVLVAIGHTKNIPIAQLVADATADVPTQAGEMLAQPWIEARNKIDSVEKNIWSIYRNKCIELKNILSHYDSNFVSGYTKNLALYKKQIDSYQNNLMRCFRDLLNKIKHIEENFNYNYERFSLFVASYLRSIDRLEKNLNTESNRYFVKLDTNLSMAEEQFGYNYTRFYRYLNSLVVDINSYEKRIIQESRRWYTFLIKSINECEKMLFAHDPQLKLKQGFSIVKDKSGKVIKSSKSVKVNDIIAVQLFEGVLDSKVEKTYDR